MKTVRYLNGYVVVYEPSSPSAMRSKNWNGWVYEHILIAEQFMGRPLRDDEEVHHLDENRANNHPGNLLVLEKSQHVKLHMWLKYGQNKELNQCAFCGSPCTSKYCSTSCLHKDKRKVKDRPSKEYITEQLKSRSFENIAKEFGVSSNAIRKWMKKEDG